MCTVIIEYPNGSLLYDKSYMTFDEAWDRRLELVVELAIDEVDVWVADETELWETVEELYA